MPSPRFRQRRHSSGERGQMLVVFALSLMMAIIPGVALVVEAGNAWAHQRVAQNAADSVANAGATVLAQRLGGAAMTDSDVFAAMTAMANANSLTSFDGVYTNVKGTPIDSSGAATANDSAFVAVGSGTIPPGAQGVRAGGDQDFGTSIARAIGINSFTASADATAVTGALTGGQFLPVVFPVSLANCDGSGNTVVDLDSPWRMSNPGTTHPIGQEWIVPLCKTGGGSFMILDLDPDKNCYQEVMNPSSIQFSNFPVDVPTDTGNDCAKKIEDAVADASLRGKIVMIPICDGDCSTERGGHGTYHIIRIAAFYLDYISYSNNPNNSACKAATSPTYGTPLANIINGNGSSSCVVGWFVRYITSGPVGTGTINNGEALGIQLVR